MTQSLNFSSLFCAYAVYRAGHPEIFAWAHYYLDKSLGALNTRVLIFSSFTMAWAVGAAQLGEEPFLAVIPLGMAGARDVRLPGLHAPVCQEAYSLRAII